jgi:hypothetical protein
MPEPPLPRGDASARVSTARPNSGSTHILCLPFATAPPGADCATGLQNLQRGDLRKFYADVDTLDIYLAKNPHYEATLARLGSTCPKRMGCLYK